MGRNERRDDRDPRLRVTGACTSTPRRESPTPTWDGDTCRSASRTSRASRASRSYSASRGLAPCFWAIERSPKRGDIEKGAEPGWRYEPRHRGPFDPRVARRRVGNSHRRSRFPPGSELAAPCREARFRIRRFARRLERRARCASDLALADGALAGTDLGPRSLHRPRHAARPCRIVPDRRRAHARQRRPGRPTLLRHGSVAGHRRGQGARVPDEADGRFHEYRLDAGAHKLWHGQTIVALRIDPGNGAAAAAFAIDFIRGGGGRGAQVETLCRKL